MNNKELIKKLNGLKQINPAESWVKDNRDLLLSQISNSGAESLSFWKETTIGLQSFMTAISRPAFALGMFVLIVSGLAISASRTQILAKTKPNESLYIARLISQKVKVNTTFNTAAREKLEAQYSYERAQDISTVLADPAFNNEANQDAVAKLSASFQEEIGNAKERVSRLSALSKEEQVLVASTTEVEPLVKIADSSKDASGIQTYTQPELITEPVAPLKLSLKPELIVGASSTSIGGQNTDGTTSPKNILDSKSTESQAANKILDEAQELFDNKDYLKASEKLKEAESLTNK